MLDLLLKFHVSDLDLWPHLYMNAFFSVPSLVFIFMCMDDLPACVYVPHAKGTEVAD